MSEPSIIIVRIDARGRRLPPEGPLLLLDLCTYVSIEDKRIGF
jgi:hypothetical protein